MKNRKFIEGWEQIIAATQNINLTDTSVILDFWERIYTKQKDLFCIQDNENPEIQLSVQDYQKLYEKEHAPELPNEDTPLRNANFAVDFVADWGAANEH